MTRPTLLVHPLSALTAGAEVIGSRGAGLARLARWQLPVAPGFVVGTAAWHLSRLTTAASGPTLRSPHRSTSSSKRSSCRTGRSLDDPKDPLLLTVMTSSTARELVPEPLVVDVGLSDRTVDGLASRTRPSFAWRAYRNLIRTFCVLVYELDEGAIDAALPHEVPTPGARSPHSRSCLSATGRPWPQRAREQLDALVKAALRAAPEPTAVVVQARVFGVAAQPSGSGIVFTREPVAGAVRAFGEFRPDADWSSAGGGDPRVARIEGLTRHAPAVATTLQRDLASIEVIHRDMCEVEFTLETGELFLHDARPALRTSVASVQIAVDLVDAGLIDVEAALSRVPLSALENLGRPVVSGGQELRVLAHGEVAAPGVAVGRLAFLAERRDGRGDDLSGRIVVCADPSDVRWSFGGAAGVVLSTGSPIDSAAALARRIRRPAICAVAGLHAEEEMEVTLDAHAGVLYAGRATLTVPAPGVPLARLLAWAVDGSRCPPATCRRRARRRRLAPDLDRARAALAAAQRAQSRSSRCGCASRDGFAATCSHPGALGRRRRATSPEVGGRDSGLATQSGESAAAGGVAGSRPWILRISSAT